MGNRCMATSSRTGSRCRARSLTGKDVCAMHADPDLASRIGRAGGEQRGRQLRKRRGFTLPADYTLDTRAGRQKVRRWLLEQLLRARIAAREVFAAMAVLENEVHDSAPADLPSEVVEAELTIITADGGGWNEAAAPYALPVAVPTPAPALASGDARNPVPLNAEVQAAWEEEHRRAGFDGPPGPAPLSFVRGRGPHGEFCPPGCPHAH